MLQCCTTLHQSPMSHASWNRPQTNISRSTTITQTHPLELLYDNSPIGREPILGSRFKNSCLPFHGYYSPITILELNPSRDFWQGASRSIVEGSNIKTPCCNLHRAPDQTHQVSSWNSAAGNKPRREEERQK